jgi:hypothetical protein
MKRTIEQPISTISIKTVANRILNGWLLTILSCFIALRLIAYLGTYGCFGILILLIPGFALYKSWQPWIRYIFWGD